MSSIFGGVELDDSKQPTSVYFSKKVEEMSIRTGMSTIESIIECCEIHGIDLQMVNNFLSKSLREKVRVEAARRRLIKEKIRSLPI
ncbi:MAG: late promoter transcription accessory protein [Cyclobacteriaceae bacterium]|jgi:hypothetical protein